MSERRGVIVSWFRAVIQYYKNIYLPVIWKIVMSGNVCFALQ